MLAAVVTDPGSDGDRLAARMAVAPLFDLYGSTTRLRDAWRGAPTVTTFVRHYGCLFCHQTVAALAEALPEINARGGTLVIVGNGTVEQARFFFERRGLPRGGALVFTDPDRSAFQAAELERGYLRTFNPSSIEAYRRARAAGHKSVGVFGDLVQLGGVFVTRPPASIVFSHRSRFAGDHPELADVLGALRSGSGTYPRSE